MTSATELGVRGAGIGYRRPLIDALRAEPGRVDVVEVIADHWLRPGELDELRALVADIPAVPHGLALSVASPGRPDPGYLAGLADVVAVTGAEYYSEHLAVTSLPGLDTGHLCPPILTAASLARTVDNVRYAQDALGVPLALENITYSLELPSTEFTPAQFLGEVVERADALLLLDVTNLHINAANHGLDVDRCLGDLPLDRVAHIHLAGGFEAGGRLHDSHSELVGEPVWDLAAVVAARCRPATVVIEHDANFPEPAALFDQAARAREIFYPAGIGLRQA
ncbi:DUF692 domain-containing protein [Amycolatopsis sp. CA-230715]|uniref:DUF692 domain-containing protein n=1 Tax=Amycolatopsis sp. CA-230715 TaxID=2745196 RepID=UPI001C0296D1|nr:DUF692 domain-containing protein [Amycolatopsis sp. CA-230715]QWF85351.1 hypothetical protein HUW46_08805 [Amycolatopsis sp. CA-230715]